MLVLARAYAPDPGWVCSACRTMDAKRDKLNTCPVCGSTDLKDLDIKEEMVRIAEQHGCKIEVVDQSESLLRFGGIGCLLRYRLP